MGAVPFLDGFVDAFSCAVMPLANVVTVMYFLVDRLTVGAVEGGKELRPWWLEFAVHQGNTIYAWLDVLASERRSFPALSRTLLLAIALSYAAWINTIKACERGAADGACLVSCPEPLLHPTRFACSDPRVPLPFPQRTTPAVRHSGHHRRLARPFLLFLAPGAHHSPFQSQGDQQDALMTCTAVARRTLNEHKYKTRAGGEQNEDRPPRTVATASRAAAVSGTGCPCLPAPTAATGAAQWPGTRCRPSPAARGCWPAGR